MFLAFPVLPPNICGVCNRVPDPDELFLDTGVERANTMGGMDHLYLCPQCAGRAAVEMGFVTAVDNAELTERYFAALDEVERLSVELEAAVNPVIDRVLAMVEARRRAPRKAASDAAPASDEG